MQETQAVQWDESHADETKAGNQSADGCHTTEPAGRTWDDKELGESCKVERDGTSPQDQGERKEQMGSLVLLTRGSRGSPQVAQEVREKIKAMPLGIGRAASWIQEYRQAREQQEREAESTYEAKDAALL